VGNGDAGDGRSEFWGRRLMIPELAVDDADILWRVRPRSGTTVSAFRGGVRWFASTVIGAWLFARVLHRIDRLVFRLTGGRRTATAILSGLPVIMLTTTGARTGLPRTVPVLGFAIGPDVAVAAGNFGQAEDPAWCLNLRHEPRAHIVVDGQLRSVVAEELAGEAREAVWQTCLSVYPGGSAYARRAGARAIGVFLLRRASPSPPAEG
jgi:deazaflavin-dependent oxidoreductase (nitroreductase family)